MRTRESYEYSRVFARERERRSHSSVARAFLRILCTWQLGKHPAPFLHNCARKSWSYSDGRAELERWCTVPDRARPIKANNERKETVKKEEESARACRGTLIRVYCNTDASKHGLQSRRVSFRIGWIIDEDRYPSVQSVLPCYNRSCPLQKSEASNLRDKTTESWTPLLVLSNGGWKS